jgi:hypothetical protein
MKKFTLFFGLILFTSFLKAFAQTNYCKTELDMTWLQTNAPSRYQRFVDLENFTTNYINGQSQISARLINGNGIIVIPVVVHVLYKTGTQSISDLRIQSQIDVLNADFRKLNADAANTPSIFQPVASDLGIEFRLACIDPNGNPTTGIVRKETSIEQFNRMYKPDGTIDEVATGVKTNPNGSAAWDSYRYLNIWVCNFDAEGIATYPADFSAYPEYDGIIINTRSFGNENGAIYPHNKGRVATHEVGHWLNLRHLWGDPPQYQTNENCLLDDGVGDTPQQKFASSADASYCPSFPHTLALCNLSDISTMFMNYMDYASDDCQNMFTTGQKSRTRALFAAGGPREQQLNNWFKVLQPASLITCVGNISLQNPACLTPVTWSVISGPATIISGQNSNQVSIQGTGDGTVLLRAVAGNYVSEASFSINDNGPDPIVTVFTDYNMVHCMVIKYKWTVVGADHATTYKWYYRNITQGQTSFPSIPFATTTNNSIGAPSDGSCDQIEVKVEASNACSQNNPQVYTFIADLCPPFLDEGCSYPPGSLLVSPNPSTGQMQLQLVNDPNVTPQNTQTRQIRMIRIIDKMGQIKKQISGNLSDKMNIDISELPADIYSILVYDGSIWVSKQIIKN